MVTYTWIPIQKGLSPFCKQKAQSREAVEELFCSNGDLIIDDYESNIWRIYRVQLYVGKDGINRCHYELDNVIIFD